MRKNHHFSAITRVLTGALLFALLASPAAADGATAKAAAKRKATPRRSAAWMAAAKTPSPSLPNPQATPVAVSPSTIEAPPASPTGSTELAQARAVLQTYINKYPILAGTTVRIGDAATYQAITFVGQAEIVISSNHAASLDQIIGHEIWHVIDWRDNQRMDWGERVPPASY